MKDYSAHYISVDASARDALKLLDVLTEAESKTLFVLSGNKLVGTLTDGDIRRGLLKGKEISDCLKEFMFTNFKRLSRTQVNPEILSRYRNDKIWLVPVLNDADEIEEIIDLKNQRTVLPTVALIMAGGRGERLRPLTDSTPKPLLKIGDKPIIEINIDWLRQFGIKKFYISLRYLGHQIKDYLGDGSHKDIVIEYVEETDPLGTLGSCTLFPEITEEQVIVMNADVLTDMNFEEFYNFFKKQNAAMCIASIPYKVNVPYGIMNITDTSFITSLVEKPTYTYYANAGIYLIRTALLKTIPKGTYYNATDLMQKLIDEKSILVHYPIVQYWLDIGRYEDFIKAQHDYKQLNF